MDKGKLSSFPLSKFKIFTKRTKVKMRKYTSRIYTYIQANTI